MYFAVSIPQGGGPDSKRNEQKNRLSFQTSGSLIKGLSLYTHKGTWSRINA